MKSNGLAGVEVSVVVPVFNEAENILPLADEIAAAMERVGHTYEMVFVDDASTDATWQRIQEAQQRHPQIRGLRHQRNSGQSAGIWTGIQATQSPLLVTLDGDRQNDPVELPRMFEALRDCDFVCGARQKRQDGRLRRLSSAIARRVRMRVLKSSFCDTGCSFRVFRREALQGIFPFNGLHRFLPVLVEANGKRAKEIPICHRPRTAGESKYGVWNRLGRGIYDLLAIAWYQKRRLTPVPFVELSPAWPVRRWPQATPQGDLTARAPEFRPVEVE